METVNQLLKYLEGLRKRKVEYISMDDIIQFLWNIKRHQRVLRIPKDER